MALRGRTRRLKLGPIVGHTTEASTTIWIQVVDDPSLYRLRVQGAGLFDFVSTEPPGALEFRTAIAVAQGLRPDWRYHYDVLRIGRFVPGARGTFRTMPLPGSMANILFCPVSCNVAAVLGQWNALATFVDEAKPHFLLMMGDQIYTDEDKPDIFADHARSTPAVRRKALADRYALNWSREPVRRVLASVPTYMMWDDHDIRDGWGSLASDSPTLVQKHPRGQPIFDVCDAFYRDARDVYWHFQACHNPPSLSPVAGPPFFERKAMPFLFQCGRVLVLMLDSRTERDVFRKDFPILGADQWGLVDQVFAAIPDHIDVLVVMTPTPVASNDPRGASQKLVGGRTDDVEAFKRNDFEGVLSPPSSQDFDQLVDAAIGSHLSRILDRPVNLGNFKVSAIDEARDQWSHALSQPEQLLLLKKAAQARLVNRPPGSPRELLFVSGDIHVGAIFDIAMAEPECSVVSLTSSGISVVTVPTPVVGVTVDEDFTIASGIRSTLRDVVTEFNFGVVQVIPTGNGAEVLSALAHEGNSFAVGLDVADLL